MTTRNRRTRLWVLVAYVSLVLAALVIVSCRAAPVESGPGSTMSHDLSADTEGR